MEALVNDQVFNPSDPLIDEQADLWTDNEHWVATCQEELSAHLLNKTYGKQIPLSPGQMVTNTGFI